MTIQLSQLRRPFPRILALEVEENVIDKLQDSVPSLRCCALVCRAWYIRSRRYLLRTVTVKTIGDLDQLCTHFHDQPSITRYVSRLRIRPVMNHPHQRAEIIWIPLAVHLPCVRELSLYGNPWLPDDQDYVSFHWSTLTSLRYSHRALETIQLDRVQWRSPQELLRLLTAMPTLCNLDVRSLKFLQINHESARQAMMRSSSKINVKRLSVSMCRAIYIR